MTHLVVTGYASLDHVMQLTGRIAPDRTTHAQRAGMWPRAGGCAYFIAGTARAGGQRASPVSWVGDDMAGRDYMADMRRAGLDTGGIAVVGGARSPVAVLAYQDDGACACLYDPGPAGYEQLSRAQSAMVGGASHLCIAVGPGHLNAEILKLRQAPARLYWALKDDPSAFPPEIRARLAGAADVIFCSRAERHLVPETGAVVVETRGADGVRLSVGGVDTDLRVDPVASRDTTGAGDTLAGGFIAADMAGASPEDATRAGINAAMALLQDREERDSG